MPVVALSRFAARFAQRFTQRSSERLAARFRLPQPRRAATLCVALAAAASFAACSNPSPTRDAHANVDTITLFPIANYDQNVDHWLEPDSPGYDRPFLSPSDQQAHFRALYARYFGTGTSAASPWNSAYVAMRVYRQQGADIVALQQRRIGKFDNTGKSGAALGYGENFRPHDKAWIDAIAQNMAVDQFTQQAAYTPERRAIATGNLLVRELPTMDPSFYDRHLAGEGYPFDNLQISAVRPGTPLYVLGTSADGAWRYVQTPDVQGWVRSDGVALTDDRFVDTWRAATAKSLGAVTRCAIAAVCSASTHPPARCCRSCRITAHGRRPRRAKRPMQPPTSQQRPSNSWCRSAMRTVRRSFAPLDCATRRSPPCRSPPPRDIWRC
jgi:NLPC_P60 stabilising domain, N term/SH3 domain (SH3b1 type)